MRGALIAAALLAALFAGLGPSPLFGQVQDTTAAPAALAPDSAVPDSAVQDTTAPAHAYRPARWTVTLSLGTLGFDLLQSQPVRADRIDGLGTVLNSTTLIRDVAGQGGLQAGVSGMLNLDRTWAIRLDIAAGRFSLVPRYSGDDDLFVLSASRLTSTDDVVGWRISVGAGLRYRIASGARLQPYLEAGTSVMRWSFDASDAFPDLEDRIRQSPYLAVGALVPVTGSWRAEVRAVQRVFRSPVDPSEPQDVGPESRTLLLTAMEPVSDAFGFADTARELISELRLELAVSYGFGELPDRPETAAPPSPPAR